jgi:hypothetical protein
MKYSLFVLAVIGFGLASCERHEWKSKNGKPGTEELFNHETKEVKGHANKEGEKEGEKKPHSE